MSMSVRTLMTSRSLLLTGLVALAAIALFLTWPALSGASSAQESLSLQQQLAGVRSVHMRASFKLTTHGGARRSGTGTLEYWEEGERYRVTSKVDPGLGLAMDTDMAFDGQNLYFVSYQDGKKILSVSRQDVRARPTNLPVPLFLPMDFLSPGRDECNGCVLRLKDVSTDALWGTRLADAKVLRGSGLSTELQIPGGHYHRRPVHFRVRTQKGQVERIERVIDGGEPLASIDFSEFKTLTTGRGSLTFPHRHLLRARDDRRGAILEADIRVESLEVDPRLTPETFRIDLKEMDVAWDSEKRTFLKTSQPR